MSILVATCAFPLAVFFYVRLFVKVGPKAQKALLALLLVGAAVAWVAICVHLHSARLLLAALGPAVALAVLAVALKTRAKKNK